MNNKPNRNRKRPMKESKVSGNWYGIPDIKFVWHNTQSDPGLIYDGKYFNSYDVEDALIVDYRDYCMENGIEDRNDDGFDDWIKDNDYLVYEYLDNLIEGGYYKDVEEISSFGPFPAGYRVNGEFIYGESLKRNSVKENSMKLNVQEERRAELSPSFDGRKSFYGKAHVVTDDDGTEILYSYNTPVVEIKDGKVKLLSLWDSSQTTLRHVKEFLQQRGFKVGSKAQIAKMYGTTVESVSSNKKAVKERAENMYHHIDGGYSMVTPEYQSELIGDFWIDMIGTIDEDIDSFWFDEDEQGGIGGVRFFGECKLSGDAESEYQGDYIKFRFWFATNLFGDEFDETKIYLDVDTSLIETDLFEYEIDETNMREEQVDEFMFDYEYEVGEFIWNVIKDNATGFGYAKSNW